MRAQLCARRSGKLSIPGAFGLMYIAETLINPLYSNVAFCRDSEGDGSGHYEFWGGHDITASGDVSQNHRAVVGSRQPAGQNWPTSNNIWPAPQQDYFESGWFCNKSVMTATVTHNQSMSGAV